MRRVGWLGRLAAWLALACATTPPARAQQISWIQQLGLPRARRDPFQYSFVRAIALTPDGDVVATGQDTLKDDQGLDIPALQVCKLSNADGHTQWCVRDGGTGSAVAVDGAGFVIASGAARLSSDLRPFSVIERSPDGRPGWMQTFDVREDGQANAIALDAEGNVVAAGWTLSEPILVIKMSPLGQVLWVTRIGLPSMTGAARSLAVDSAGDVVIAGYLGDPVTDFFVAKFAGGDGHELWRYALDGSARRREETRLLRTVAFRATSSRNEDVFSRALAFDDVAVPEGADAVAIDRAGNVVVSGTIVNAGRSRDFTVVKLLGSTGTPVWRYTRDGGAHSLDRAFSVALDADANVVAAGYLRAEPYSLNSRFTVVKLSGTSGERLWERKLHGTSATHGVQINRAFSVAVGDDNAVVAAGFMENARTGRDFTAVKLEGASGAERWRVVVDAGSPTGFFADDLALSIIPGSHGGAFVGGVGSDGAGLVAKIVDGSPDERPVKDSGAAVRP
jgi:outer membrane protein assembly factor BamB